ncbi:MAG: hypothetical protein IJS53_00150, partial [Clostridia bacterium]|nr:hypothetical protein [Clostridia bacterium]
MDQKPGLDNLNKEDAYLLDDILAEYTGEEPPAAASDAAPTSAAGRTQVFEAVTDQAEHTEDTTRTHRFERPTAEQVRNYVAAFRRGESQTRARHEQEINPGFFMGGDQGKHGFRYGGQELDLSAEEGYIPHQTSEDYIPSHAPEHDGEDDELP